METSPYIVYGNDQKPSRLGGDSTEDSSFTTVIIVLAMLFIFYILFIDSDSDSDPEERSFLSNLLGGCK